MSDVLTDIQTAVAARVRSARIQERNKISDMIRKNANSGDNSNEISDYLKNLASYIEDQNSEI